MAQIFEVEYEFVPNSAHGRNTVHRRAIKAPNAREALRYAGQIGFSEFGARFTENCIDWRIV